MDWSQIGTELALALIPVLVLVITALISMGAAYVRERYEWAKRARTVDEVEDMATGTVLALQQTMVNDLKAANEDGKLTDAEKDEIKRRALAELERQLTIGQRKVLSAVTADLSAWLGNKIEKSLVDYKFDVGAGAGPLVTVVESASGAASQAG